MKKQNKKANTAENEEKAIEDDLNKSFLSREDLQEDKGILFENDNQRKALETPEGKNNGAQPEAFKNQRTNHP